MSNRAASSKAKGRRLQNSVVLKIRELFKDILVDGDIKPAIMGTSGVDVVLSPSAKNIIAFDCECKNVEKLIGSSLTKAIQQAEGNTEKNRTTLLIFKKNQEPERVILKLDDFLKLLYPNNDITFCMNDAQKIIVKLEELKHEILKSIS